MISFVDAPRSLEIVNSTPQAYSIKLRRGEPVGRPPILKIRQRRRDRAHRGVVPRTRPATLGREVSRSPGRNDVLQLTERVQDRGRRRRERPLVEVGEGVVRANFVDVNCHLSQGVRAVHSHLSDAAAPTERHHRGDGTDDRRLRRDVVEHYVARIVLFQRLVEPVQNVRMRRAREGKRPLLDALRAEGLVSPDAGLLSRMALFHVWRVHLRARGGRDGEEGVPLGFEGTRERSRHGVGSY